MQTGTGTSMARARWLGHALIAVSACLAATLATASASPPAARSYRIVPLSAASFAAGDINARGQVAFTEAAGEVFRSRFYDGKTLREIGTLGGPATWVAALNDHGQVAGYSLIGPPGSVFHAYVWSQATGIVDIQGAGQTEVESLAADINNRGQVAGTSGGRAFLWSRASGMLPLATLGLNAGAYGLNDQGVVVGFSLVLDEVGDPMDIPVRWSAPDRILALSSLGSRVSGARDINAAGQIVGSAPVPTAPFGAEHAFLWTPQAGLLDLFPGNTGFSNASKINDQGTIIGNLPVSGGPGRAFVRTRDGAVFEIGPPDSASSALDLNQQGQVVGSLNERAYVWSRQEGVVDLNTRVPHAPAGLVLVSAVGIAENGAILASANTGLVLLLPQGGAGQAPVAGPVNNSGAARVGLPLSFSASFTDADPHDTHTAKWSWGDGSHTAGTVSGKNGNGSVSGQHVYRKPGIYTVTLTITDSGGRSTRVERKVVVCGAGAQIAGQGLFLSPPGALKAAPQQSGVAELAFLAAPAGRGGTSVRFASPGLHLSSRGEATLMVGGGKLSATGEALVNGKPGYRYRLNASTDARGEDRVRLQVWRLDAGTGKEMLDYDNGIGQDDAAGAAIGRGAIRAQAD